MTVQFRSLNFQASVDVREMFIIAAPFVMNPASIKTLLDLLDQLYAPMPLAPSSFDSSLKGLGLAQQIKKIEETRVSKFFAPENLERIGRREGKPGFVAELQDMCANPQSYTEKQKLRMAQFVSNQYNDSIGAPRTTVKFYDGEANTNGFFRPGGDTIFINRKSPQIAGSFVKLLGTVVHENTHNDQYNANIYGNPVLSRIYRAYRANFQNYRDATRYGYHAYKSQPVEIGAFAAGNMAESMLNGLCASNDNRLRPSFGRRGYPYGLAA